MVKNSDGKIAVQHRKTNPTAIQIQNTDRQYYFSPLHNVCLAWVEEQDLEKILAIMEKSCDCNGGARTNKFFVASEINVNIYETGDPQRRTNGSSV
jgi:hypothetical protein